MTAFRVTGLYVASLDGKVCNRRVTEDCKSRCQGTGPVVMGKNWVDEIHQEFRSIGSM